MGKQKCTRCGKAKALDRFRQRSDRKSPNSVCVECDRSDSIQRWRAKRLAANGGLFECKLCRARKPPEDFARIARGGHTCNSCYERPTCRRCGEAKPRAEFYMRPSGAVSAHICIPCYKSEHAEYYQLRKSNDPRAHMFRNLKDRARLRGQDFSITIEDIVIPERCPVFGMTLLPVGHAEREGASPTVDRIDSSRGYVPGNVAVISHAANSLKRDGTAEQHEAIARYMRAHGAR